MSADGEAQEAMINLARDLGIGIVGSPDDIRKAIAQKISADRDACETERDRLRTEVARLREIALSDDVRGMLSAHGSDGTILVVGEFSSGREFCEKFRLSAQVAEVPELDPGANPHQRNIDNPGSFGWSLNRAYRDGYNEARKNARLVPTPPQDDAVMGSDVERLNALLSEQVEMVATLTRERDEARAILKDCHWIAESHTGSPDHMADSLDNIKQTTTPTPGAQV